MIAADIETLEMQGLRLPEVVHNVDAEATHEAIPVAAVNFSLLTNNTIIPLKSG